MSENEIQQAEEAVEETAPEAVEAATEAEAAADPEEISYHAVEKDGEISAIWEMQGKKHIRTISRIHSDHYVWMDRFTIRNLERDI